VLKNLRYFAAALGMRGWRREDAVVRVVKEVDLVAYADQPVSRASGGQYSRVSPAVALLNRPDLLVMDEPTGWSSTASPRRAPRSRGSPHRPRRTSLIGRAAPLFPLAGRRPRPAVMGVGHRTLWVPSPMAERWPGV
jgi:hypothetical protein